MVLAALAFFITARTKPVASGPNKYGRGTSIVLYNVPSAAAATQWADGYIKRTLLEPGTGQKLTELKVLPVHDRLLTSRGEGNIDWGWLRKHATDNADVHLAERGSSGMLLPPNGGTNEKSSLSASEDVEALRKTLEEPDRWNWNRKKPAYYIIYHEERAFVVRAANFFLVSRPYLIAVKNTPDGRHKALIHSWPGAQNYQESENLP